MEQQKMTAEEMERLFDEGDMRYLEYFDLSTARRPGLEKQSVSVDLPAGLVNKLDQEAKDTGVPRHEIVVRALSNYFQKVAV
jgi:hypothetical protein